MWSADCLDHVLGMGRQACTMPCNHNGLAPGDNFQDDAAAMRDAHVAV